MKDTILFLIDVLRAKAGLLPKTQVGASAMGRRAGRFVSRHNPYLPDWNGKFGFSFSTMVRLNAPIVVSYQGNPVSPQTASFQLAYNQSIWDYHMKP